MQYTYYTLLYNTHVALFSFIVQVTHGWSQRGVGL